MMPEPRLTAALLARAVARAEPALAGEHGSAVTQAILTRLHEQLGKLIGPEGFDAVLTRALLQARRRHPTLAGITAAPGGKLEVLRSVRFDREGNGYGEDALAIVSQVIELLVKLVGEDVAMRMLREHWPAAPDDGTQ